MLFISLRLNKLSTYGFKFMLTQRNWDKPEEACPSSSFVVFVLIFLDLICSKSITNEDDVIRIYNWHEGAEIDAIIPLCTQNSL